MTDSVDLLRSSVDLVQACATGEALLKDGDALSALRHFDTLLSEYPSSTDALEGTVKALLVCVANGSVGAFGEPSKLDAMLRRLILQPGCDVRPAALARTIAAHHSSGAQDVVVSMGRLLSGALKSIHAEGRINKNSVVLLLLVRETQQEWISDDNVRVLHLEWFYRFELEDLTLPYNFLFGRGYEQINRGEVASLVRSPGYVKDPASPFSVLHALYIELLSGDRLFDDTDDLLKFLSLRQQSWDRSVQSAKAARSLVVRYRAAVNPRFKSYLDALLSRDPSPVDGSMPPVLPMLAVPTDDVAARAEVLMQRLRSRAWQGVQAARSVVAIHSPFLRLARRPKIAVCLSGQLRGYQKAFASWQRSFLPTFDHTIFVHTWESIGRSSAEPFRYVLPFEGRHFAKRYRETCLQIGFEEFKARYPTLFAALTESGRTTAEEVGEFYRTEHVRVDRESAAPFANMSNQQKMHSKIEASYDLAMRSSQEFDLVIRLRPDKPIHTLAFNWSTVREVCDTTPTLFADHAFGMHYANPGMGDQFAVGGMIAMNIYSRTWTTYPALSAAGLFQCSAEFTGHITLAQVCWTHGVRVEKIPMRFGALQEAEPLSTQAILACLTADAIGREDYSDHELIAAARADATQ